MYDKFGTNIELKQFSLSTLAKKLVPPLEELGHAMHSSGLHSPSQTIVNLSIVTI